MQPRNKSFILYFYFYFFVFSFFGHLPQMLARSTTRGALTRPGASMSPPQAIEVIALPQHKSNLSHPIFCLLLSSAVDAKHEARAAYETLVTTHSLLPLSCLRYDISH